MADAAAHVALLVGALLSLLAAIGVTRFPDPLLRMQALAKASALGAGSFALALAIAAPDPGSVARAVALLAFLLLTGPMASQTLARAALRSGAPLWPGTHVDEPGWQAPVDGRDAGP